MATYSLPDLWQQWQQGNLSAEQAVGHVLQNQLTLLQRLTDLEKPGPPVWNRRQPRTAPLADARPAARKPKP